ncbi:lipopolysaccharide biosynthesis protein [Pseudomarimonas salicorniae]|uniref:Lipopolysaccharide biosynthesis protein n=1 Tax=Pseudomarimonas salicorniae TaxID=2933270 RepID=A0ABT0GIZ2_9GAMM|nr:lipopolysaccharide biosynthesis protein [Lysobacter sp. CAU 1642]MCK7593982.1 lipopolysaccharide biosynthesis protein [Lysobacter sp. CAU 1642]
MAGLLRHASRYAISSALVTLASLVSFPILTRLLSTADYGLMSTVTATIGLVVAIGKLGMQKATVRFYHEQRRLDPEHGADTLAATQLLGMTAMGAIATLLWAGLLAVLPAEWLNSDQLKALLLLTVVLVWLRVTESALHNLLYAQERSGTISLYSIIRRYLSLILVVAALWFISADARHLFLATILAEALAIGGLLWVVLRAAPLRPSRFSSPLLRAMLAFGLPMVGMEMAWSLLAVGDRYVIQILLGAAQVGIYSASYNLCEYAKLATMAAVATAVGPMYMRIWEEQGREATEAFLATYSRGFLAFSMLVATLVSVNAEPLITILASEKFVAGTEIVPWVMFGLALESYVGVAAAGLFLRKRSQAMFGLAAAAALFNLLLNVLLIPRFGLVGAAFATTASFALLLALALWMGRNELRVGFPWWTFVVSAVAFVVSDTVTMALRSGSPWWDLVLHSFVALGLFSLIVGLFDASVRGSVRLLVPRLAARWRR